MSTRQAQIDKVLEKFRAFIRNKFHVDVPEAQVSNDFICQKIIELKTAHGEKIRAITTLDEFEVYLTELYMIKGPLDENQSSVVLDEPLKERCQGIVELMDAMRADPEIFPKLLLYRNALFDLLS